MKQTIPTRHGALAASITGRGQPVVLLHSGGHDRSDFGAITPSLARRHEVIAIDLPGHGESEMFSPPSAATARKTSEAIVDALDALDRPPAVLVGNSVGGTAALLSAIERPERTRGLVLVSTSGLVERTLVARGFCWVQGREVVRRRTGMAFARHYLKLRNEHTEALLERMRLRRGSPDFISMEAALWRSFGERSSGLEARVSEIRCPTLLVWGRRDPVLRARVEGKRCRQLLPHAEWTEMDCGHVPFVEDPEGFLSAIAPFLRRLSLDGPRAERAGATGARP
jgi:pimeloyl-ACP methyl ester carboxylesterase